MLPIKTQFKYNDTDKTKRQTKATLRYHYIPTRMVKIKYIDHIKYWQGCGATKTH